MYISLKLKIVRKKEWELVYIKTAITKFCVLYNNLRKDTICLQWSEITNQETLFMWKLLKVIRNLSNAFQTVRYTNNTYSLSLSLSLSFCNQVKKHFYWLKKLLVIFYITNTYKSGNLPWIYAYNYYCFRVYPLPCFLILKSELMQCSKVYFREWTYIKHKIHMNCSTKHESMRCPSIVTVALFR